MMIVGRYRRGRLDVVEKPTMLVIEDNQQRRFP
jgi:hypothetical protein